MAEATAPSQRTPGGPFKAALAFQRAIDRLSEWTGWLSQWFVAVTILVGFSNTALRYVGSATGRQLTSNTMVDLQWNMYALIFLLGFGYVLKHGINVRVDFWYAHQPHRRKLKIDLIGHLIALVPFTMIGVWVSLPAVQTSLRLGERSPNSGGLPIYPIKAMILLAFILLFLQAVSEVIKLIAALRGYAGVPEEPEVPIRIE